MDLGHATVIHGSIISQEQNTLLNSDSDCNNVSIVSDADSFVASHNKIQEPWNDVTQRVSCVEYVHP